MWELGDRRPQSPRFTKSLLFSISLLGKPPHSSIMSMATGKNLRSIPKKVSNVEPCEPGPFLRDGCAEGTEPRGGGRGLRQDFRQPQGRWWRGAGKRPPPLGLPVSWRARRAWRRRGRCRGSDGPPSSLQTQHYFLLCFSLKFSLTVSSCLLCFGFTLQSFCDSSRARNLTNCSSIMLSRWVLIPPPLARPRPTLPGPRGG